MIYSNARECPHKDEGTDCIATAAKDYLSLPLKSAIKKHSLNIVNKDTTLKFSKLGKKGASVGACMLSRSKLLGLI